MRRQRGVTLIEVAISIVIAAILFALGLPAMNNMISNIRVRGAAEEIAGGLQRARIEAMKRNQAVTFNIDAAEGAGWSVVLDSDQSIIESRASATGNTVSVQGDLDILARFNNLGMRIAPLGGDLTFSVTHPTAGECQPSGVIRCLSVIVRIGGQVRMCDPQRPVGDPQACSF